MSLTLPQILASLGALVCYLAEWAGVIFLRRSSAKIPWCLMTTGLSISTLSTAYFMIGPMVGMSPFSSNESIEWWSTASRCGGVAFALGFALYGLQMARASQRQGELEQLVGAMSEEMDRLKEINSRNSPS